jgi:hypothetical protein
MVRVLGCRAEPALINWAVVEGDSDVPVLVVADSLAAPKLYGEAEALGWFRVQVHRLIDQFSPSIVAVRFPEAFVPSRARDADRRRCRVEGVVIEAAIAKGMKVRTGALATISRRLETESAKAKAYLETKEFRGLDWSNFPKYVREAILVAVSGLSTNGDSSRD